MTEHEERQKWMEFLLRVNLHLGHDGREVIKRKWKTIGMVDIYNIEDAEKALSNCVVIPADEYEGLRRALWIVWRRFHELANTQVETIDGETSYYVRGFDSWNDLFIRLGFLEPERHPRNELYRETPAAHAFAQEMKEKDHD